MTTKININKANKVWSVTDQKQNSSVKLVGNKKGASVVLSFLSDLRTAESDDAALTAYEDIIPGVKNKQDSITFTFAGGRTVIIGKKLYGFAQSVNGGDVIETAADWTAYVDANPLPGPTPGQTFTLTTNADTATANVFNGNVKIEGLFALNTLNNGDRLTGTGTNPTLNVTLNTANGAAGAINPAALTNIQTANFEFAAFGGAAAAANLGFQNATGLTTVSWANAGAASALNGLGAALTDLSVTNTQFQQTFLFTDAALAGGADALNLTVNANVSGANGIRINTVNGTSYYETVNISSQGSTVNNFDVTQNAGASSYTTLNVSGAAPFTTTNRSAALSVFNASTATGNVSYTANGEGNASYTGGSGSDNFILGASFTNQDTVNGGTGTDTITTDTTQATGYAAVTPVTVSGVEVLAITDALGGDLTTSRISSDIATLELQTVTGAARTVNTPAGTFTVKNDADSALTDGTGALTIDVAGTATTDVLNVQNVATAANINNFGNGAFAATDYETVNFSTGTNTVIGAQQVSTLTITPTAGATSTLNLTGVNSLRATGAITANVINASGLTGAGFLRMDVAAAAGLTSITGSANADTLRGDVSSSISGGAGADTIVGNTGNDTLLGGEGNDAITSDTGNDSIDGGAGNDSVTMAANLTAADTVSGGEGTEDSLLLTTADITAAQASNTSNFEILVLTNGALGGATTVTMTNFIANPGFTNVVLNNNNGQAVTIANASASLNTLGLGAGFGLDSAVFQRLVDTTTNALTLRTEGTPGAAITAVTANDEETITATTAFNGTNEATTITTLTAGDLSTLNIEGTANYTITALAAAGVSTINASGSTGVVTINTQASAVNPLTVTAGTGGLIFSSGTAADTITGSVGNDNIWGWTGADTINVGTGTDTLRYSAGDSTATVGNADTAAYATPAANSISTVGMDVVTGLAAGDILNLNNQSIAGGATGYTTAAAVPGAAGALDTLGLTATNLTLAAGQGNGIEIVRGTYTAATNIFVGSATGADSLIIYDADTLNTATAFRSFVAIGYVAGAGSTGAANGLVTLN